MTDFMEDPDDTVESVSLSDLDSEIAQAVDGVDMLRKVVLRILIRGTDTGLIIGKGGDTVKYIKQISGAGKVHVIQDPEKEKGVIPPQRVVEVAGTLHQCSTAQHHICEILSAEANSDESRVLQFLIPNVLTGAVIGKKGCQIKAINSRSNAVVDLTPDSAMLPGMAERVVTITGTPAALRIACILVTDVVEQARERFGAAPRVAPTTATLNITPSLATALAAAFGDGLVTLKEMSGAHVVVVDMEADATELSLVVIGNIAQVEHALDIIYGSFSEVGLGKATFSGGGTYSGSGTFLPASSNSSTTVPSWEHTALPPTKRPSGGLSVSTGSTAPYSRGPPSPVYDDFSSVPESESPFHDSVITVSINVPDARCGVLIGKNGTSVKYIMAESGTKIVVADESETNPVTNERPVQVTGTAKQIAAAQYLIRAKIQRAEAQDASKGGEMVTRTVLVPTSRCAMIIGKSGVSVKAMMADSGAKIVVGDEDETDAETNERPVRISGTQSAVAAAVALLDSRLEQIEAQQAQQHVQRPSSRTAVRTKSADTLLPEVRRAMPSRPHTALHNGYRPSHSGAHSPQGYQTLHGLSPTSLNAFGSHHHHNQQPPPQSPLPGNGYGNHSYGSGMPKRSRARRLSQDEIFSRPEGGFSPDGFEPLNRWGPAALNGGGRKPRALHSDSSLTARSDSSHHRMDHSGAWRWREPPVLSEQGAGSGHSYESVASLPLGNGFSLERNRSGSATSIEGAMKRVDLGDYWRPEIWATNSQQQVPDGFFSGPGGDSPPAWDIWG